MKTVILLSVESTLPVYGPKMLWSVVSRPFSTTLSPKSPFYKNMVAVCGQVNACVPLISCILVRLFRTAQRTEKDTFRQLSCCLLLFIHNDPFTDMIPNVL